MKEGWLKILKPLSLEITIFCEKVRMLIGRAPYCVENDVVFFACKTPLACLIFAVNISIWCNDIVFGKF